MHSRGDFLKQTYCRELTFDCDCTPFFQRLHVTATHLAAPVLLQRGAPCPSPPAPLGLGALGRGGSKIRTPRSWHSYGRPASLGPFFKEVRPAASFQDDGHLGPASGRVNPGEGNTCNNRRRTAAVSVAHFQEAAGCTLVTRGAAAYRNKTRRGTAWRRSLCRA